MKVKVNVWQVGFMDMKSYMLREGDKAVCKERGYVMIENKEGWEEDVWNLLNWSCWNYDENGNVVKPDDVYSSLDHCNSDVILQIDGTNDYRRAELVDWTKYNSLEQAMTALKNDPHSLWPLAEAPREYCRLRSNGVIVEGSNDGKNWITL